MLDRSFSAHRDHTALVFSHRSYRYAELSEATRRVAALLQRQNVAAGDRVLLLTGAKEPFLLAYLGTMFAGCVPLPVNPHSKLPELLYYVDDSQASAIVHDDESAAIALPLGNQCASVRTLITAQEVLAAENRTRLLLASFAPDDPALMLYSSGTTGAPKGVVHTQANLASAVRAIVDVWQFNSDDVLGNVLPLFHIHGLSFATNVCLVSGGTMLIGDRFHPVETLDLIDRSTVFMGVPPYYYAFLKRDEFRERAKNRKRLRLVTCGSAPIRADVLPQLESVFGRPVINRYGMTECHVLTSLPLSGPWPCGAVGRALGGVEVVVRGDDGMACEAGEIGKVWARGPNLFRGYWRRPEATAESFDSAGWFDTGDIGKFDEASFLRLIGRSKELIIVGGFNVYPTVVERVVNEYPGVRECAVVGVPDLSRGERVGLFIVAEGGDIDVRRVRAFCRERLSDYQCPSHVEVISELPRNTMGKVLKRELLRRLCGAEPVAE